MNRLLFGDRTDPADGLGRLAATLVSEIPGLKPVSKLDEITPEVSALVHCRRDPELLPGLIDHCQNTGTPLLNLSTGFEVDLPENLQFLYLECPNISLEVLAFMQRVQVACESMQSPFFLHITEHHQASKKDRSGTAQAMIDRAALRPNSQNQAGYYRCAVRSVRNLEETRAAGFAVLPEHENGYAIHVARLLAQDQETERQTLPPLEIYGRKTYAEGLHTILETVQRLEAVTGNLHIADFARSHNLI